MHLLQKYITYNKIYCVAIFMTAGGSIQFLLPNPENIFKKKQLIIPAPCPKVILECYKNTPFVDMRPSAFDIGCGMLVSVSADTGRVT